MLQFSALMSLRARDELVICARMSDLLWPQRMVRVRAWQIMDRETSRNYSIIENNRTKTSMI